MSSIKQVQKAIKLSLGMINKAIKQVPEDKKHLLISRVSNVLSKYVPNQNTLSDQALNKFSKQLQFNLNFIKLSHPHLDYTELNQNQIQTASKQAGLTGENQKEKDYQHKFDFVDQDGVSVERTNKADVFDKMPNIPVEQFRKQVDFLNWIQGNVDPEALRRHKDLLLRQNFKGDFWEGKQKPRSDAKEYLKSMLSTEQTFSPKEQVQLEDFNPEGDEVSEGWEKVQR